MLSVDALSKRDPCKRVGRREPMLVRTGIVGVRNDRLPTLDVELLLDERNVLVKNHRKMSPIVVLFPIHCEAELINNNVAPNKKFKRK